VGFTRRTAEHDLKNDLLRSPRFWDVPQLLVDPIEELFSHKIEPALASGHSGGDCLDTLVQNRVNPCCKLEGEMSDRETRLARNEALFREVNERIAELTNLRITDQLQIVCECANRGCQEVIRLSLDEYERVRQHPRRFLVVSGHTVPDIENLIESRDGYDIVEKHADVMAEAQLEPA
jgi:hypothetical protein